MEGTGVGVSTVAESGGSEAIETAGSGAVGAGVGLGIAGGVLNVKVEEIAATDDVAASHAASLATLVTLARGFTAPLAANPANNGLRQLLKTAAVAQKHNRVVITATLSPALLANLAKAESSEEPAPEIAPPASK